MTDAGTDSLFKTREQIDEFNRLAWELRDREPRRAFGLAEQALALSNLSTGESSPYQRGKALALVTMGIVSTRLNNNGLALNYLQGAYFLLENMPYPDIRATTAQAIGWTHFLLGNTSEAYQYLQTALGILQEIGDWEKEAEVLISLGTFHSETGSHPESMEAFQKALRMHQDKPPSRAKGVALNNLALAQITAGNYAEALVSAHTSLQIVRELGFTSLEASCLETLSRAYIGLGELAKAEEVLDSSLSIAREVGAVSAEMAAMLSLGEVYWKQDRYTLACEHLHQAVSLAESRGNSIYRYKCHELLATIHESQGQLLDSLVHYKEFHAAREQARAESAQLRMENLKILHQVETNRKEAEILLLQNQALEQEIEDRRRDHLELERLAVTDSLTGLYNRRHFLTLGDYELAKAQRMGTPLTLLMLDLDHFKAVNDLHGHSTGDRVLESIAKLIVTNARAGDYCFRYGGEEFVILLPETRLAHGMEIAERMRHLVACAPFRADRRLICITASLGAVQAQPEDADLGAVMARADAAMYRAKSAGRNCVSV
jgi:diguanylate cyclase (GGDEF)-like protein